MQNRQADQHTGTPTNIQAFADLHINAQSGRTHFRLIIKHIQTHIPTFMLVLTVSGPVTYIFIKCRQVCGI